MIAARRWVFAVLCVWTAIAAAYELPEELQNVPNADSRARQMGEAFRAQFDIAVAEYEKELALHPEDVAAAVERCKFMQSTAYLFESGDFVDELYEGEASCFADLAARWPEHPEAILTGLERLYGAERLKAGEELLTRASPPVWTSGQMSRLYVLLVQSAQLTKDRRLLDFARAALRFDERADVRIVIAQVLAEQRKLSEAVSVLTSPADAHDSTDPWYALQKMDLLAQAGARDAVIAVYESAKQLEHFDTGAAVAALRRAGAIDAARDAFKRIAAEDARRVAGDRFRFELEHGSAQEALSAYTLWRDEGWQQDPLGIHRAALFVRAPTLALQARDLLGLLGFLGTVLVVAAIAAIPIGIVHYRGLARRVHTMEAYPVGGWRLRDAWFVLFGFFCASVVALYSAGSVGLLTNGEGLIAIDATPQQVAKIGLVGQFILLALLLPVAMRAAQVQPQWWGDRWSIWRSLFVGAMVGCVFRIPLLIALATNHGVTQPPGVQQALWELLESVRDAYGVATALWLVAVAAPVLEELMFRGVLLRAFTAHLRFAWANVLQAALFALIHFDLRLTPMLFGFGLVTGFLAQKSGGLVASITLHFVFNLIAAIAFLA